MKNPKLIIVIAASTALISMIGIKWQRNYDQPRSDLDLGSIYKQENGEMENEEKERQSGAGRQLNTWFQAKAYPDPTNLTGKYQRAWEQYQELKRRTWGHQTARVTTYNWTPMGYATSGGSRIGGRVVCLAVDPSNTNNLWAGSAGGGIWKSTDAGANWTQVVTNLNVLGVSAILVHPTNSNIIYAGTGEVYTTTVNDAGGGFNVWKTRGTFGIGVIKSSDGGATWTQVLSKVESDLFAIQSMCFLPGNSNTILACATDGVYRSTNSGVSWTQIYSGSNVRDIAINPSNTDQMVISVGNMMNTTKGIFRTTNGSNASPTWTKITTGLPSSFLGYINLDNASTGALYASVGVNSLLNSIEIYSSSDFGATWSSVGTSATTAHCSYQYWFAHCVAVNPFFTDSIMFGGVNFYRYKVSTNGRGTNSGPHADVHDIEFDPIRRGTVYTCTDGGIYKSTNGGTSWSNINTGLNAIQFYASLGVSKTNANRMIGGLQDNGEVMYNGTTWAAISWGGGDGTACAIHPSNDNIILASRDARQIYRSSNGGTSGGAVTNYWGFSGDSRTAFVTPIAIAPSNGNIVYQASDNIHISSDAGATWTNNSLGATPPYPATSPTAFIEQRHKTAIALAVSPTNQNKIYVSTSPYAQKDNDDPDIYINGTPNVFRTSTPSTTPYTSIKGTLPDRFVMDFAISRYNDDSVYIVLGGFGTSHVYLTPDGGLTWQSISAGLPDVPFNAILIDPVNPKTIYAGCDLGVYVSTDRGQTWSDYNLGFNDATLVMDLQVDANNKLIAVTHGKGAFKTDLYVPIVTPVKLLSFSGKAFSDGTNKLDWTVENQENFSHYELERSTDGMYFRKLSAIPCNGSSNRTSYSTIDGTPFFESYYRLKMVDRDGTYSYSSIVFIRQTAFTAEFSVAGNPFRSDILLKYRLPVDGQMQVELFNAIGASLRLYRFNATGGNGTYKLTDLSGYPAGSYYLRCLFGGYRKTISLVKE